ncbi:energy transducer TonB [Planctobacterium marinum]|uniref:Protein TonB n=1 Tax=Planctobacterium marinum TaxID=1631968 RepID=A0AA48HDB1_9ALTE|nr:protein TonB [Planctobacterium marinum]
MTSNIQSSIPSNVANPQLLYRSAKLSGLLLIASGITLALFWMMSQLIAQSDVEVIEPGAYIPITAVLDEPEEMQVTEKTLPSKPEPIEPPKLLPDNLEPDTSNNDLNGIGGGFTIVGPQIETQAHTSLGVSGGEARPIVRISPQYPVAAARDGIEGWVVLSFSINETGGVEDIEVLDAEPKRIFNREATRALRKWKYRPKIVDGKPVKQSNITVQLDFKLEQ